MANRRQEEIRTRALRANDIQSDDSSSGGGDEDGEQGEEMQEQQCSQSSPCSGKKVVVEIPTLREAVHPL